jgi:hypothetical protein
LKGNGNIFLIFSFERTFKTIYIILFYCFFSYLAYFYKYFDWKEWNVRRLQLICMSRHNRGHAIFLSRQPLIILHSKLYSVCPPKYQDHSKPLKHLSINIWSATNTSPKLPLTPFRHSPVASILRDRRAWNLKSSVQCTSYEYRNTTIRFRNKRFN